MLLGWGAVGPDRKRSAPAVPPVTVHQVPDRRRHTLGMANHRPSPFLFASEGPRASGELGAFVAHAGPLLATSPRGDGHGVLVLPGFTGDDFSTRPLRWFLRRLGYHASGWRLGVNIGPTDRIIDGLIARFERLTRDGEPISLIGWSLGGIYARELAYLSPSLVRQVITLGSPFQIEDREQSNAGPLYDLLSTFHSSRVTDDVPPDEVRGDLPVPSTAIYTRTDGVVPWRSTREPDGPSRESIAVRGSHSGLGHNPRALRIIADRLSQPAGSWVPYALGAERASSRLTGPRSGV